MTSRYTPQSSYASHSSYIPRYSAPQSQAGYLEYEYENEKGKTIPSPLELLPDESMLKRFLEEELPDQVDLTSIAGNDTQTLLTLGQSQSIEPKSFLSNVMNTVTVRHHGSFAPLHVTAVAYRDGSDKHRDTRVSENILNRALYLLFGTDYPFRDLNPEDAFGFLKTFRYVAVVEGTRFFDGTKPVVNVFICTQDDGLRLEMAKRDEVWNSIMTIKVISKCKSDCKDLAGELRSRRIYEQVKKGFVVPPTPEEVGMVARELYQDFMASSDSDEDAADEEQTQAERDYAAITRKVNDQIEYSRQQREQQEQQERIEYYRQQRAQREQRGDEGVASRYSRLASSEGYMSSKRQPQWFRVIDNCKVASPCTLVTEVIPVDFESTEVFYFLCEDHIVHFMCWLSKHISGDANARLTVATVKDEWRVKLHTVGQEGVVTLTRPNLRPMGKEMYPVYVFLLVGVLRMLMEQLIVDDKEESSCCGIIAWIKKEIIERLKCLESFMKERKDEDLSVACNALLRGKLMVELNRVMQFHLQIEETLKQNSMTLVGKPAALVSSIYCKMANRVVPWLLRRSRIVEGMYNATRMYFDLKAVPQCIAKLVIPSRFVQLQHARLLLVDAIPTAFLDKDKNKTAEPDRDALLRHIAHNPGSPSSMMAQQYIHLQDAIHTERKMGEYQLVSKEVQEAACQVSELLRNACGKNLLSPEQADQWLLVFRSVLTDFSATLGQSDGRLLKGMLDSCKKDHQIIMDHCIQGLRHSMKMQRTFADIIEAIGPNPLLTKILKENKQGSGLLNGLGTLMAIQQDAPNNELLCVANAKHCARDVTESVLAGMARIADSLRTPSGTVGRNAALDLLKNDVIFGTDGHLFVASQGPFGSGFFDLGKLVEL